MTVHDEETDLDDGVPVSFTTALFTTSVVVLVAALALWLSRAVGK